MPDPTVRAFRIWVRRSTERGGSYAIRFELHRARGLLRVVRPGVTVDPPARPTGIEEGLTASQLLQSRFILAAEGGRARQAVLFGRIDPVGLSTLEPEVWHECGDLEADGRRYVVLATSMVDEEDVDDQPTDVQRMIAELRHHLRNASPVVDDDHLRVLAGSSVVGEVASFDQAEVGSSLTHAPTLIPVEPPISLPPQAVEEATSDMETLHARPTTLVRFLRRQVERDRRRIAELEEQVRRLGAAHEPAARR